MEANRKGWVGRVRDWWATEWQQLQDYPPYPLTSDEWAFIQRREQEREHLAQMLAWRVEDALR